MKLVLHGLLRDLYGASIEFAADTVADAIEGFSRQMPDYPRDLLIDAVGFDTAESLHAPTTDSEINLIPAMFGGGGNIGKILIGAALIAIAVINPVVGGYILTQAAAGAILGAGIGLVIGGVMGMFFKAPTISKSEDPAASKYLGANKNTTTIGTPIILAWGRVKLAGHFLSIQVDSNKLSFGVWPEVPA